MFYHINGSVLSANCGVKPDAGVSGIGVRGALYLQAVLTLLLSMIDRKHPREILFSNISMQATSLALILAAFFDPTIDVQHTLVASMFAVMFSTCRMTSYDLSASFVNSLAGLKTLSRLWLCDLFFRVPLLIFNYRIWSVIRALQMDNTICPEGVGEWSFFSRPVDLKETSTASRVAFSYCVFDIVWQCSRYMAAIVRLWIQDRRGVVALKCQISIDPRLWILRTLIFRRWNFYSNMRMSSLILFCSFIRKVAVWIYVIVNVEKIVTRNGLADEVRWTFGQIFPIVNISGLFAVLIGRFIPSSMNFSLERSARVVFNRLLRIYVLSVGMFVDGLLYFVIFLASPTSIMKYSHGFWGGTALFGQLLFIIWFLSVTIYGVTCILVKFPRFASPIFGLARACYDSISKPIKYAFLKEDVQERDLERKAIETSLNINPTQWWWIERLAGLCEIQGDLGGAKQQWEQLVELFPDQWWPRYRLAQVLEEQEDFDAAIREWCRLMVNTDPEDPNRHLWAKRFDGALRRNLDHTKAVIQWQLLAGNSPERNEYLQHLIDVYRHRGGSGAVIDGLKDLVAAYPEEIKFVVELAKAYEKVGDLNAAYTTLRTLSVRLPDDRSAEACLAKAYRLKLENGRKRHVYCIKFWLSWRTGRTNEQPKCRLCDEYLGGLSLESLQELHQHFNFKRDLRSVWTGDGMFEWSANVVRRYMTWQEKAFKFD